MDPTSSNTFRSRFSAKTEGCWRREGSDWTSRLPLSPCRGTSSLWGGRGFPSPPAATSISGRSVDLRVCHWFLDEEQSEQVNTADRHRLRLTCRERVPLRAPLIARRETPSLTWSSGATERLLSHNGAGGFIVYIVVPRGVSQGFRRLVDHIPATQRGRQIKTKTSNRDQNTQNDRGINEEKVCCCDLLTEILILCVWVQRSTQREKAEGFRRSWKINPLYGNVLAGFPVSVTSEETPESKLASQLMWNTDALC